MNYAAGISASEASMRTLDFKDKFFPGIHWQRQSNLVGFEDSKSVKSETGTESQSRTESMHVDNILAGIRHDDISKSVAAKSTIGSKDRIIKEKELKYAAT